MLMKKHKVLKTLTNHQQKQQRVWDIGYVETFEIVHWQKVTGLSSAQQNVIEQLLDVWRGRSRVRGAECFFIHLKVTINIRFDQSLQARKKQEIHNHL